MDDNIPGKKMAVLGRICCGMMGAGGNVDAHRRWWKPSSCGVWDVGVCEDGEDVVE